jgi:hypothetical protein
MQRLARQIVSIVSALLPLLVENMIRSLVIIGHLLRCMEDHLVSTRFSADVFLETSGYLVLFQEEVVSLW